MNRFTARLITVMIALLLLQTMMVINAQGKNKFHPKRPPHCTRTAIPTMPEVQLSPTPPPVATPTPEAVEGLEIERKFLIDPYNIPYDLNSLDKYEVTQAYINYSPEIRVRKADDMYFLTVKAPIDTAGMVREERDFWITEEEYKNLLNKTDDNTIYKTRYQGIDNGVIFAIDIYKESLQGLAVLEIEFKNVAEANNYTPPAWVGPDVTNDKRYKNGSLAKNGLP